MEEKDTLEKATFAGGCFWCFEAIFKRLKGVNEVVSGYSGGTTDNPTYESIHYNKTGHAETVEVTFDPKIISYKILLEVFWHLHDPTTKNRQGNDIGEEYRSVIFYNSEEQKRLAEETKKEAQKKYKDTIVTEILPCTKFYPAEPNHQNYYDRNQDAPYCRYVIDPKITKLYKDFKDEVKDD